MLIFNMKAHQDPIQIGHEPRVECRQLSLDSKQITQEEVERIRIENTIEEVQHNDKMGEQLDVNLRWRFFDGDEQIINHWNDAVVPGNKRQQVWFRFRNRLNMFEAIGSHPNPPLSNDVEVGGGASH